ncbi:MAG: hypothetical protein SCH71_05060 [Desulfobulbaceae bacterium]|nr:hypothetical protein [Desulfobulbaceae bacterium]
MPERLTSRRKALVKIYGLFEKWAKDFDFACEKGCATCCTQSVTMTTLEGKLIHAYIKSDPELLPLLDHLPENSPTPAATTNRFALACLQGEETPEEDQPWNLNPCIFLRDNCCTIYPVRSFMCRSFGSRVPCHLTGSAEVDPLFLTLNTVIMQCIEHLDQGRPWGNMNTILRSLAGPGNKESKSTLTAEPIPGLLIPPDEAEKLGAQLNILMGIIRKR